MTLDSACHASTKFRTITGKCNNLNNPYWGAMSTPFSREIAVGEYNPKTDITISDGTGVDGGDYGRSTRKGKCKEKEYYISIIKTTKSHTNNTKETCILKVIFPCN